MAWVSGPDASFFLSIKTQIEGFVRVYPAPPLHIDFLKDLHSSKVIGFFHLLLMETTL